jgi:hypothetical protein
MVDLWIMQPTKFIEIALEEGFRKFAWQFHQNLAKKQEVLAWARAETAAYGPIKMLLIDESGAAEYTTFSSYLEPVAVYPTWSWQDDEWDDLVALLENPVGEDEELCNNPAISPEMRPVFGQDHKVVVWYLPPGGEGRQQFVLQLAELQKQYPNARIVLSGCSRYSDLFGFGFQEVTHQLGCISGAQIFNGRVQLPTGKSLRPQAVHDRRYQDWFHLVGMDQIDLVEKEDFITYCLRSVSWAAKNFNRVTPFVYTGQDARNGTTNVYVPSEYHKVSDRDFILPAARRRAMRNLGLNAGELDKVLCDTCILHNACTLYREGSVCTVKGSDTVALADSFGTRNAQTIIGGLLELTKRTAERYDDAAAKEEANGELDPEVTKIGKTLFDQGVKLAKLIDPALNGPKVQVNVGVNGNAQVAVSNTDPKQVMATVVEQLEAAGIPRHAIDGDMIKGVLRNMAQSDGPQAISTAAAKYQVQQHQKQKQIEGKAS